MMTVRPYRPRCSNCRFWKDPGRDDYGQCRRHAPRPTFEQLVMDDQEQRPNLFAIFPKTGSEDWCGDYEMVAD